MTASDRLNESAKVISEVSDALFLSQSILIDVRNFLQAVGDSVKGYESARNRSR